MGYHQLTSGERHALSALRKQGIRQAGIARALGRCPSTISRELKRNSRQDGSYRPAVADEMTRGRRSRSRRNQRFRGEDWALVCSLLKERWSPEQITGRLARQGVLRISHETIYRYVWEDRRRGGLVYRYLRGAQKKKWKRYRSYDSRGRLAGKRPISSDRQAQRTALASAYLEGDTVLGSADRHCVLSLVDRKSGYLLLGKLRSRTTQATTRRASSLIKGAPPVQPELSPSTTGPSFTDTRTWRERPAPSCYSRRPTTPGSGAPARTPTASSDSISPSVRAWLESPKRTVTESLPPSTTDPAGGSASSPPRRYLRINPTNHYDRCTSNLTSSRDPLPP
jgi:IS30 family transposase